MDVLQLLKSEFRNQRSDLAGLSAADLSAERKTDVLTRLQIHLAWESEFLLPELSVIATHGDALLEKYTQGLNLLQSLAGEDCQDSMPIILAFDKHIDTVEEKILPFMRQKIPTVDREDLYHVFIDAKQELQNTRGVGFAIGSIQALGNKPLTDFRI